MAESLITDEIRALIGVEGPEITMSEPVERGALRRLSGNDAGARADNALAASVNFAALCAI